MTRRKGCVEKFADFSDFDPNATYAVGDIIKSGQFVMPGRAGGGRDIYAAILMKHGKVPRKLSNGVQLTSMSIQPSGGPAMSAGSPVATRLYLRVVNWDPPATATTIANFLSGTTDAAVGVNKSDMIFMVNQEWADGLNLISPAEFTDSFRGSDAFYRCIKAYSVTKPYAPPSISAGFDVGNPTLFDSAYWEAVTTEEATRLAQVDYATVFEPGDARTDCQGENDFQAKICGRCGRQLQ